MSRGLGSMQRMLLRRMAAREVERAETAAQEQVLYDPPRGWSIANLFFGLSRAELRDRLIEPQRRQHEKDRRAWLDLMERVVAGDERAKEEFNLKLHAARLVGTTPPGSQDEFTPVLPEAYWDRFNASRVMRGLVSRQLVCRRPFHSRQEGWALTREGFAEARRLGDVAASEIIDLDQLQERWCETRLLPFHQAAFWLRDEVEAE
jgi:hypothetical protein